MNENQIKLIYEYMGIPNLTVQEHFPLNSNSAWECVQELELRGDWRLFKAFAWRVTDGDTTLWLYNPDNFFRCLGEFLENRGE